MKIVGARWTPRVNMLVIVCDCGREFEHRADRWRVRCTCGCQGHLAELRDNIKPGDIRSD